MDPCASSLHLAFQCGGRRSQDGGQPVGQLRLPLHSVDVLGHHNTHSCGPTRPVPPLPADTSHQQREPSHFLLCKTELSTLEVLCLLCKLQHKNFTVNLCVSAFDGRDGSADQPGDSVAALATGTQCWLQALAVPRKSRAVGSETGTAQTRERSMGDRSTVRTPRSQRRSEGKTVTPQRP